MKSFFQRLWHRVLGREIVLPPPPQEPPSFPLPKKTQSEPPLPVRGERTLIVGVDFGTSSTKVIWQDLSDNKFEILAWYPDETGLRAFLLPSTIDISNSKIYYGRPTRRRLTAKFGYRRLSCAYYVETIPTFAHVGTHLRRRVWSPFPAPVRFFPPACSPACS
jgi:hypothetical protein